MCQKSAIEMRKKLNTKNPLTITSTYINIVNFREREREREKNM